LGLTAAAATGALLPGAASAGAQVPQAKGCSSAFALNASVSAIQIRGQRLADQVLVFSGVEAPPKN
jgi:hypothetical protein